MEIDKMVDSYNELISEIQVIIKNNSNNLNIDDCRNLNWRVDDGILYVQYADSEIDDYPMIMSSFSDLEKMEENFFSGEKDGLSFVMAYDENKGWNSAIVHILTTKLRKY